MNVKLRTVKKISFLEIVEEAHFRIHRLYHAPGEAMEGLQWAVLMARGWRQQKAQLGLS